MQISVYTEVIIQSTTDSLLVRCGRCQGTGSRDRDGRDPQCKVCNGAGQVRVRIRPHSNSFVCCGFCRGDGTRDKDGRDPVCPVCHGVGGIMAQLPAVPCQKCDGTGSRDRDGRTPICKSCQGTGIISTASLKTY